MKYNMGMDKKELTLDYIANSDTYVYQRKDMFRINTDTSQLAHFMKIEKGDRVLDVGTNNGALLLHASKQEPSFLYGIDIQEEACELARYNMDVFKIQNVVIECIDFKRFNQDGFNVIVSNPPYFKQGEHREPNPSMRAIARHEIYLELDSLIDKVSKSLHPNGRFYMVHRANRIEDIVATCKQYGMSVRTIQYIFDHRFKEAKSVLVEAIIQNDIETKIEKPIIL